MIKSIDRFFIYFFVALSLSEVGLARVHCESAHLGSASASLEKRQRLITTKSVYQPEEWLWSLDRQDLILYHGSHVYRRGSEFLASNEEAWSKTPIDQEKTDVLVGFGTNSAWDIAFRKRAEELIIADWSPWPVLAHAYFLAPLIRIAKSPQEFLCHFLEFQSRTSPQFRSLKRLNSFASLKAYQATFALRRFHDF